MISKVAYSGKNLVQGRKIARVGSIRADVQAVAVEPFDQTAGPPPSTG
jgi:hypothetical protein